MGLQFYQVLEANKDEKVDFATLKRIVQYTVEKWRNPYNKHRFETVNVTMDTMLQRIFLIPKKNTNKASS